MSPAQRVRAALERVGERAVRLREGEPPMPFAASIQPRRPAASGGGVGVLGGRLCQKHRKINVKMV